MKKHTIYVLPLLFLCSLTAEAQIINFGEFNVLENTQISSIEDFENRATGSIINDGEIFFYSNLTNNGILDYTIGGNGLTRFISDNTQDISGSEFCFFNNIVFNNTTSGLNDISLNTSISIADQANFTNGIVNSESALGAIIFENNAVAFNASNESFVDGTADKEGATDFEFPIGDQEHYRPASIGAPLESSSEFSAKYFFENPGLNFPVANRTGVIELISDSEYWTIENTSGSEEVFITLSFNEATTPASILAEPQSAIYIVRWDEPQQLWIAEGGVIDTANNTISTRTTISDYGVFTLGRVDEDLILPGGGVIYNAISANNDGINDFFLIDNIEDFENNKVEIFNKWGTKVFSTKMYGTSENVFRGESRGNSESFLPSGTYFYVISYDYTTNETTQRVQTAGYLYLNSD